MARKHGDLGLALRGSGKATTPKQVVMKLSGKSVVEYPVQGETICSRHYSLRVGDVRLTSGRSPLAKMGVAA